MGILEQLEYLIAELASAPGWKAVLVASGATAYAAVGGPQGAYLSLVALIIVEAVLDVITSIKNGTWNIEDLLKFPKKILLYWATIACAMHVDDAVASFIVDVDWINSPIKMYKFCILWFSVTELMYIAKNIELWGIKVPYSKMKLYLGKLLKIEDYYPKENKKKSSRRRQTIEEEDDTNNYRG